jgi:hypothetical protein
MAVTEVGIATATEPRTAPWTETTRLLCAAAYTEVTFAQEVVEQLLEEDYRAVEVPPAVDAAPVIKHCLVAFAQKMARDRLLAAILGLVLLYLVVVGNTVALSFAVVWGALAFLAGRGAKHLLRRGFAVFLAVGAVAWLVIAGGDVVVALGLLTAWATVTYDLWRATYKIVRKRLNARDFDPAAAPAVASGELARRTDEIAARQAGNLTVYSGFLPFAGAGRDLGGWSFVVDLRKGREELGHRCEPQPVEPQELYAGVERALRDILQISDLTIEDRLFVNGTDIRDDRVLLPSPVGRPSASAPDAELRRLMLAPTRRVRHYTCIRVTDRRGELVLSLYLRFAVANRRLFCELSGFLLTPLKPELHRSDGISPEPELEDLARLAWRSLVLTPVLWFRSPAAVLRPLLRQRRSAKQLRMVERNAFFDYGPPSPCWTACDRRTTRATSRCSTRRCTPRCSSARSSTRSSASSTPATSTRASSSSAARRSSTTVSWCRADRSRPRTSRSGQTH